MHADLEAMREFARKLGRVAQELDGTDQHVFSNACGACAGTALSGGLAGNADRERRGVRAHADEFDWLALLVKHAADAFERQDNENADRQRRAQDKI